jgi:hypothetical protein
MRYNFYYFLLPERSLFSVYEQAQIKNQLSVFLFKITLTISTLKDKHNLKSTKKIIEKMKKQLRILT